MTVKGMISASRHEAETSALLHTVGPIASGFEGPPAAFSPGGPLLSTPRFWIVPSESAVPICVLSDIAIIREVLENYPAHFQSVHASLGFVENLAIHPD